MAQNLNQFGQTAQLGELDLGANSNPQIIRCKINPGSSTTGLIAGQSVKLVDLGSSDAAGLPIVDVTTSDGDLVFGAIIFSAKKGTFLKGDIVEVAIEGAVMRLTAGASLNRGVPVMFDYDVPGAVLAATVAGYIAGITLDKIASGALGRVMLLTDGLAQTIAIDNVTGLGTGWLAKLKASST